MKKNLISTVILFVFCSTLYGCATIFNGYEDAVVLSNIPDDLKIYDNDNLELPIQNKTKVKQYFRSGGEIFDSTLITGKYISLRSNVDHVLTLTSAEGKKTVRMYPKISAGWFILDILTFTFAVDMYTGNWNHFDDINFTNIK